MDTDGDDHDDTATAPEGARIEVRDLTKRFGSFTAVDDLSFTVEPGRITGFLGPNGAGKTTTLRMLLGLVHPTGGTATIGGQRLPRHAHPACRSSGSALEATNFHPGRSGRDHLRVLADAGGRRRSAGRRDARAGRHPGGRAQAGRRLLAWACASASASRPPCSATPRSSSSTSRPTASTPRASGGCAASCATCPARARRSSSPATCSRRSSRPSTTSSSSPTAASSSRAPWPTCTASRACSCAPPTPTRLAGALRVADVTSDAGPTAPLVADTDDLRLVGDVALRAGLPIYELRPAATDLEALFFELTEGTNRNLGDAGAGTPPSGTPSPARKGRTNDPPPIRSRVPQVLHHPDVVGHGDRHRSSPAPASPSLFGFLFTSDAVTSGADGQGAPIGDADPDRQQRLHRRPRRSATCSP